MIAYYLIFLGALLRLLPHPANFAPIAALALFGAVYLDRRNALLVPLAGVILSDIFIGFDSLASRLTVYSSFLLVGLIGLWVREHKSVGTVLGTTVLGSTLFFLITNFTLFYPPVMYAHDLNGILSSYANALPFFRNTLLGDLFYIGIFFGVYELVKLWRERRVLVGAAPAD